MIIYYLHNKVSLPVVLREFVVDGGDERSLSVKPLWCFVVESSRVTRSGTKVLSFGYKNSVLLTRFPTLREKRTISPFLLLPNEPKDITLSVDL